MNKIGLVIILFISILSCSTKQEDNIPEISFDVNQQLLSDEFVLSDLGIGFSPPGSCNPVKPDVLASLREEAHNTDNTSELVVTPENIFINKSKTFTCFVSSIKNTFENDMLKMYIIDFIENNHNAELQRGSFEHNNLEFTQLTLTEDNFVLIKLLTEVDTNNIFMIDYRIPIKHYEEELRAIESSIGSITKTKGESI